MLKVEYLADGSPDCPLIRFHDVEAAGFEQLQQLARELSGKAPLRLDLADDPAFELMNMPHFVLSNEGSAGAQSSGEAFEWRLDPYDWETVALLLDPVIESGEKGFQWLDQLSTHSVGLPVVASRSADGQW